MDDKELMQQVVSEFMEAFEKKDKALLLEALTALIHHIQDLDEQQDQMENMS